MSTKRLRSLLTHFGTRSPAKETDSPISASAEVSNPELPTYDKLPMFKNLPGCAWGVWGEDDQLGTVNLLTEKVVQRAAREEILTGHAISLNWPLNFPEKPVFKRQTPEVKTNLRGISPVIRDDVIHINTQSGTQWDGLRHYGVVEHGVYYNNIPGLSLSVGVAPIPNPNAIDASEARLGMQNWADHGICGRGILLDLVRYQSKDDTVPLPYDPWTTHAITVTDLEACATAQGVSFRQGDILLLRVGFIQKYYTVSQEERDTLPGRPETFAGIEQSEDMKRFLWDNHFAAIASDQPSLERWPTPQGIPHMHQTLLGLWGMPIGEFFDLEKLAVKCAETGRYTFFFSSWPLNIIGGCASPPNAALTPVLHDVEERSKEPICEISAISQNSLDLPQVHQMGTIWMKCHVTAFPVASSPPPTMSRRESRVSMGARQNDALFEFENFKKKFLLANKHITKLNSTLSVRIEELNAEISKLYVENLKLKASEITLVAQLKREREKSRKVMAEAEAATHNLTKHLGYLRQTLNIPTVSSVQEPPPAPRARKPPSIVNTDPGSSPQGNRLSRPPNVPGICEEEELSPLSSESELTKSPSPVLRKVKAKSRRSASRLPVPSRTSSPPPQSDDAFQVGSEYVTASKPRKPSRRQSGMLSINTEVLSVPRASSPAFGSPMRRAAGIAAEEEEIATVTDQLLDVEDDMDPESKLPFQRKERRKSRGKERGTPEESELAVKDSKYRERKKKEKLDGETDGGGKPRLQDVTNSRTALISIDNTVPSSATARAFLTTSPTPSAPTSRGSSSPVPPGEGEGSTCIRERRQRKSVNYAEPKLNTKMRKPDPPSGTVPQKKRSSAAAILTPYCPPEDTGNDADNDTEARSLLELAPRTNGTPIHPQSLPLPSSRSTSSMAMIISPPPPRLSVKRKKSRPISEDGDSDGAEADAEYVVPLNPLWINVDGRRRAAFSSGTSSGSKEDMVVLDDLRPHSLAV